MAKYEEIISKPVAQLNDSIPEQARHLKTGWKLVPYHMEAKCRWNSSTIPQDKFSITHPTCHSRFLAKLLLASVSDDFCITIIHHIDQACHNGGVVILWSIMSRVLTLPLWTQ
jgi:hypothetical protein